MKSLFYQPTTNHRMCTFLSPLYFINGYDNDDDDKVKRATYYTAYYQGISYRSVPSLLARNIGVVAKTNLINKLCKRRIK